MKTRPITFTTLDQMLQVLGFRATRAPGAHIVYAHPDSGAVIVLRWYENDEVLDPTTLEVVRRPLVDRGILAQEQWEDFLRERSLAG